MKKTIIGIGIFVFTLITVLCFGLDYNSKELFISDLTFANLEALAENEGPSRECPGGSCTFKNNIGECSACCPKGKSAICDVFGCRCE